MRNKLIQQHDTGEKGVLAIPGNSYVTTTCPEALFKKLDCPCVYERRGNSSWKDSLVPLAEGEVLLCIAAEVPCTCCKNQKIDIFLTSRGELVKEFSGEDWRMVDVMDVKEKEDV